MASKIICLITGANQGLGFEAARVLISHPTKTYHVLLGCRDAAKGEAAAAELRQGPGVTGTVSPLLLDVTSTESAERAAAEVAAEHGRLDVLLNNAGIISQADTVLERLSTALTTNVTGCAIVTEAFLPLLLKEEVKDGRLVFVGSSMGSLTGASDTKSRYYKAVTGHSPMEYRISKAALNMMMIEYWKQYGLHEGGRLRVYGADPGPNATNFMGDAERARNLGVQGPEVGAKQLAACVTGERDGGEGKMWGVYGESPW
ncbi:dehydrogenase with different specificitie [Xylariales sp. PMI_506]|nr:dehydrogenase with different specificitie [Xylariales sp. PMI_506]